MANNEVVDASARTAPCGAVGARRGAAEAGRGRFNTTSLGAEFGGGDGIGAWGRDTGDATGAGRCVSVGLVDGGSAECGRGSTA